MDRNALMLFGCRGVSRRAHTPRQQGPDVIGPPPSSVAVITARPMQRCPHSASTLRSAILNNRVRPSSTAENDPLLTRCRGIRPAERGPIPTARVMTFDSFRCPNQSNHDSCDRGLNWRARPARHRYARLSPPNRTARRAPRVNNTTTGCRCAHRGETSTTRTGARDFVDALTGSSTVSSKVGRASKSASASHTIRLAVSPSRWPPSPSATAHKPISIRSTNPSSLLPRT